VKTKTQLRNTVKQTCDKDHRNTSVAYHKIPNATLQATV